MIISIVGTIGTLENKLSTSNDAVNPLQLLDLSISMTSDDDNWYVEVGICEIIGLSGWLGLWILTLPYIYPGLKSPIISLNFKSFCAALILRISM